MIRRDVDEEGSYPPIIHRRCLLLHRPPCVWCPRTSRGRVRMVAGVATSVGQTAPWGLVLRKKDSTVNLRKQGSGPYLSVTAAARAPRSHRRPHGNTIPPAGVVVHRRSSAWPWRLEQAGIGIRRTFTTEGVHPYDARRVGAPRRPHHRTGRTGGRVRAAGGRVPGHRGRSTPPTSSPRSTSGAPWAPPSASGRCAR